jgi:hypothetical protein
LLRFARNDGVLPRNALAAISDSIVKQLMRIRALAARCARVVQEIFALENKGRRKRRMHAAPAAPRAK